MITGIKINVNRFFMKKRINNYMELDFINQITNNVLPLAGLLIAGILGMSLKQLIGDIVASIRWKFKPNFEPGDKVYVDNEPAIIISIGYRETIFEIQKENERVWRHVENKRIPWLKLERQIKQL